MENNNFITIQGWMRNTLNLTGNDLIVFSVIYGFSQDSNSKFTGSLQYLADWCGSTKQGVQKNLKNLIDRGLIEKEEEEINKIKFCKYKVSPSCIPYNSVVGGMQLSCTNNINNISSLNNNIKENIKNIIIYLNNKCETHFRPSNKSTQKHISARLNEGYTVDDFYKVIDNKVAEWKDNPQMCQYLRPDTLFGTKFESYLNQKMVSTPPKPGIEINQKQREGMIDIVDWGM